MENILNFINEEKTKLEAENLRRQQESDARAARRAVAAELVMSKLKPLEDLKIDGHACTISTKDMCGERTFKIEYGAPWTPKFESYILRNTVEFTLTGYGIRGAEETSIFKVTKMDFMYHVTEKNKNHEYTLDELLQLLAKYFARLIK